MSLSGPTSKWNDFKRSALGAMIAETITIPINTLKTYIQNSPRKLYISSREGITQLYREGGWFRFYRGLTPSIISQMTSTGIKYTLYQWLEYHNTDHVYVRTIINGMKSGFISSLICHPIDSIKIRVQMGDRDICNKILKNPLLLYRGYSKGLTKTLTASCLYFPLTDIIYSLTGIYYISVLASALISTTIIQPLDYLKTTQIYRHDYTNIGNELRYSYRGYGLNLFRVVPQFCIIMMIAHYMG